MGAPLGSLLATSGGASEALLEDQWERLWGASWRTLAEAPLVDHMSASGTPLGDRWRRFWGALGRSMGAPLGSLLATSGGASGAPLGDQWDASRAPQRLWATNGSASGAPLGNFWRRFCGAFGRPIEVLLGRLLATSGGTSGAPLGDQWERL